MRAVHPPAARPGGSHLRLKPRLRAHQVRMYRLRREVGSVDCGPVRGSRLPVQVVLRRLGAEAARLSAGTRYCSVTQREVRAAIQRLHHHHRHPDHPHGA